MSIMICNIIQNVCKALQRDIKELVSSWWAQMSDSKYVQNMFVRYEGALAHPVSKFIALSERCMYWMYIFLQFMKNLKEYSLQSHNETFSVTVYKRSYTECTL